MPNVPNPDEIYHKASSGRLQNTNNEADSYDEIHFISMDVEGSDEYERQKQYWHKNSLERLDHKYIIIIMFCIVAVSGFTIACALYDWYLHYVIYFVIAAVVILFVITTYYLIRRIKLTRAIKKFEKRQKNPPQNP